jgi:hypothetical protein
MVIDGSVEFVGSDARAARAAIDEAGEIRKLPLSLRTRADGDTLQLTIRTDAPLPADAVLLVAVVENDLHSKVTRGENGGRVLHHTAVVRELRDAGMITRGQAIDQKIELRVSPDWKRDNLRIVAFVQENKSRRVVALRTSSAAD